VPLITVRPRDGVDVWVIAAVLTSPLASVWAWHQAGGTGLSADALRLGPRWLGGVPWPAGDLTTAVEALRSGDVSGCGAEVLTAAGCGSAGAAVAAWWRERLPVARHAGLGRRQPLPDSR
jgi:hypothetical protein